MIAESLAHFQGRLSLRDGFESLEKSDIAELSATAINMTRDDLVRMIRVANLASFFPSDLDQHLPFYDRTVQMQLAHLPQRCCHND